MIIRFLLLAAIVYFVYAWLRGSAARARGSAAPRQENMVTCANCGVHLPQSDSVAEGARFYCNDEHRLAGPKPN
jgi:uncharacterized protein